MATNVFRADGPPQASLKPRVCPDPPPEIPPFGSNEFLLACRRLVGGGVTAFTSALPELQGSPGQVHYATELRKSMLERWRGELCYKTAVVFSAVATIRQATWWIQHKDACTGEELSYPWWWFVDDDAPAASASTSTDAPAALKVAGKR